MSLRLRSSLVLGSALVAACTAPGASVAPSSPGASASPPPVAGVPVSNQVERDGVTLTIQIDAGQVRSGEPVRLIVTATNTEPGIVMWQGGGCDLLGNITLTGPDTAVVPVGDPPQGNDAAAMAGLIRWAALAGGVAGHSTFVPPNLPPGGNFGCPSDLRINELRPGETVRVEARWSGRTSDGIPAPAGDYRVGVSFPFLARQAGGEFEGDPFADAKPLVVDVPYQVLGEAWQGLTAAQAVDRALADGRVQAWVAAIQRTQIGGARIHLQDGGRWRFEVDVMGPTGETAGVAVVEVDPGSGAVTRVELPPL